MPTRVNYWPLEGQGCKNIEISCIAENKFGQHEYTYGVAGRLTIFLSTPKPHHRLCFDSGRSSPLLDSLELQVERLCSYSLCHHAIKYVLCTVLTKLELESDNPFLNDGVLVLDPDFKMPRKLVELNLVRDPRTVRSKEDISYTGFAYDTSGDKDARNAYVIKRCF